MNLGSTELIILLVIVLLVFGGSQLPKLAKNLGKAQTEFKKGLEQGAKTGDSAEAEETIDQKLARLAEIDKANTDKPADA